MNEWMKAHKIEERIKSNIKSHFIIINIIDWWYKWKRSMCSLCLRPYILSFKMIYERIRNWNDLPHRLLKWGVETRATNVTRKFSKKKERKKAELWMRERERHFIGTLSEYLFIHISFKCVWKPVYTTAAGQDTYCSH